MNAHVAGATGAIGRSLISALVSARHNVFGMTSGSVDILARAERPQAVEVEGKTGWECLGNLNGQAATGGPRGEFGFYRGEGGFDLDTLAVGLRGKAAEHQVANFAVGSPATPYRQRVKIETTF